MKRDMYTMLQTTLINQTDARAPDACACDAVIEN